MKPNITTLAYKIIRHDYVSRQERLNAIDTAGYTLTEISREIVRIYILAYKVLLGEFGDTEWAIKQKLGSYYSPVSYIIANYF